MSGLVRRDAELGDQASLMESSAAKQHARAVDKVRSTLICEPHAGIQDPSVAARDGCD